MQQYVFYGGKGGVGKTTAAAATALAAADRGERTLVVSTDPAHSLADAYGLEPGTGRRQITDGLWMIEVGPEAGERTYRTVLESVADELRSAGIRLDDEEIERLFAAGIAPGSDELAALECIAGTLDEDFDRVVVDTAPTGHTLRLLDLPDVLRETLAATSSLRGQVRRLVDGARSAVFGPAYYAFGRGGDDADEESLSALADRMAAVRDLVRAPDRAEFRVVTTPEPMAVAETRRFVEELARDDVPVETVVVNRVLRDVDADCERCRTRAVQHAEQLRALREAFPGRAVVELPEFDADADQRTALGDLGARLVADY
ncbi:ArsA family ATPase [Halorubellus litoreus]|uniref:ArsA family ATPase n=1 Tax=Halorubellus litoreus TaxID=755308 RepID=A0ABD5VIH4_9EURY